MLQRRWMQGVVLWALTMTMTMTVALAEPTTKTFMWEVASPTNTVYLLGTPGVASSDFYPMSPWIEAAYMRATRVAVTADLSDNERFAREATDVYYHGTDSIDQHLSAAVLRSVEDLYAGRGESFKVPPSIKPYVLATSMQNHELVQLGISPEYDVPFYMVARARADNKPVQEMIGIKGEVAALEALTPDMQETWVRSAVANLASGKYKDTIASMLSCWKEGNVVCYSQMERLTLEAGEKGEALHHALVSSNRTELMSAIDAQLASGEVQLVLIPANQLVGEGGLLETLKTRGYRVQQL